MTDLIVADASPLIGLARIGLLSLLKNLYERVLIPPKVHEELQLESARPGWEALRTSLDENWLIVMAPHPITQWESLLKRLEDGEAEAIRLAGQLGARILIDEKRGRVIARQCGLQVVGTGAVLLLAKERHLLDSVADALDRLAAIKYRITPDLRERLLSMAGEL